MENAGESVDMHYENDIAKPFSAQKNGSTNTSSIRHELQHTHTHTVSLWEPMGVQTQNYDMSSFLVQQHDWTVTAHIHKKIIPNSSQLWLGQESFWLSAVCDYFTEAYYLMKVNMITILSAREVFLCEQTDPSQHPPRHHRCLSSHRSETDSRRPAPAFIRKHQRRGPKDPRALMGQYSRCARYH